MAYIRFCSSFASGIKYNWIFIQSNNDSIEHFKFLFEKFAKRQSFNIKKYSSMGKTHPSLESAVGTTNYQQWLLDNNGIFITEDELLCKKSCDGCRIQSKRISKKYSN